MIPTELKPFWPLIRSRIMKALQGTPPTQLGLELAQQAREQLPPAEQRTLAQALVVAAQELSA